MSYELNGLEYDSTRKQMTNIKQFHQNGNTVNSQYVPVPYNFDFSLYLYVRNIEDGNQIIEHILPFFTPDYTIKVNMIPEMGIVKEVPIILKDTKYEVTYEGDYTSDTRAVIWTLNFTVKGFIFGASGTAGLIQTSITNILNNIPTDQNIIFKVNAGGNGTYKTNELVYQGINPSLSTASGKVVQWLPANNQLTLTNLTGNFVSNTFPLIGQTSNAKWIFNSYKIVQNNYSTITITPNPTTANANSNYTYTTVIQESL